MTRITLTVDNDFFCLLEFLSSTFFQLIQRKINGSRDMSFFVLFAGKDFYKFEVLIVGKHFQKVFQSDELQFRHSKRRCIKRIPFLKDIRSLLSEFSVKGQRQHHHSASCLPFADASTLQPSFY